MIFRQGDVIIEDEMVPSEITEKEDKVIARGESTGHTHRIKSGDAKLLVAPNTVMYIKAYSPTTIGHEEHGDIVLPVGEYSIRMQREYDWYSEEVKNVVD